MGEGKFRVADEQEDVLRDKDHVTKQGRGLQVWGDVTMPQQEGVDVGTATTGTAERSARITGAQLAARGDPRTEPHESTDEPEEG